MRRPWTRQSRPSTKPLRLNSASADPAGHTVSCWRVGGDSSSKLLQKAKAVVRCPRPVPVQPPSAAPCRLRFALGSQMRPTSPVPSARQHEGSTHHGRPEVSPRRARPARLAAPTPNCHPAQDRGTARSSNPPKSVIGGGGNSIRLSIGQKQLLCFCRALLRDAPILCLDEANSAMDSSVEEEVLVPVIKWCLRYAEIDKPTSRSLFHSGISRPRVPASSLRPMSFDSAFSRSYSCRVYVRLRGFAEREAS